MLQRTTVAAMFVTAFFASQVGAFADSLASSSAGTSGDSEMSTMNSRASGGVNNYYPPVSTAPANTGKAPGVIWGDGQGEAKAVQDALTRRNQSTYEKPNPPSRDNTTQSYSWPTRYPAYYNNQIGYRTTAAPTTVKKATKPAHK